MDNLAWFHPDNITWPVTIGVEVVCSLVAGKWLFAQACEFAVVVLSEFLEVVFGTDVAWSAARKMDLYFHGSTGLVGVWFGHIYERTDVP